MRAAACPASTKAVRNQGLPLRVRPLRRLPALSSLPGQSPAHDARWRAVGNGEAGAVTPTLRHPHLSGPLAHAGDALQPRHLGRKRADPLRTLGAHPLEAGVQEVAVGELLRKEEAVMGAELTGQRLLQLGELLAPPATGELGEQRAVARSAHQRLQQVAPRLAADVGGDGGQLAGGPFPHLLQAVDLMGPVVDQGRAGARQFAQLALGPVGDEGMKLARNKPWRKRSAIHSASRTSVLRPGTALLCWALTTTSAKFPSSRL